MAFHRVCMGSIDKLCAHQKYSEGAATIGFGTIFSFILVSQEQFMALYTDGFSPNILKNARILTPNERDLAIWRLEAEAGEAEAHHRLGVWDGFKLAVKDPMV